MRNGRNDTVYNTGKQTNKRTPRETDTDKQRKEMLGFNRGSSKVPQNSKPLYNSLLACMHGAFSECLTFSKVA